MLHATIIAKAPVAGRVKTRLCPPCSPEQAAAVAAAALRESVDALLSVASRVDARPTLLIDGEPPAWIPDAFTIVAQRGAGLGERLANGFVDLGPGVIVGMETPHVVGRLGGALEALERDTDVMGMATDGGYWMIGLGPSSTSIAGEVFTGVPMSRSHTGLCQLRRLHALGRPVRLIDAARDLDTFDDLVSITRSGRAGRLADTAQQVIDTLG